MLRVVRDALVIGPAAFPPEPALGQKVREEAQKIERRWRPAPEKAE
jgi:hypothetical protein